MHIRILKRNLVVVCTYLLTRVLEDSTNNRKCILFWLWDELGLAYCMANVLAYSEFKYSYNFSRPNLFNKLLMAPETH